MCHTSTLLFCVDLHIFLSDKKIIFPLHDHKAAAVKEWVNSEDAIHIMRDHPHVRKSSADENMFSTKQLWSPPSSLNFCSTAHGRCWQVCGVHGCQGETKVTPGQKSRNHSITNATFCLAQPKQVNMGLKTIFGSSNIYLDQVLANQIFLMIKINC